MNKILRKEIWIKAPIDQVFDCFTKSEAMLTWHGKKVELNPVPGGVYRVVFENGTEIIGAFKQVIPNERIIYSARYGKVDSLIEINFVEEKNGVRIKIKQEFFLDQETSSFDHGWEYFLCILKQQLTVDEK